MQKNSEYQQFRVGPVAFLTTDNDFPMDSGDRLPPQKSSSTISNSTRSSSGRSNSNDNNNNSSSSRNDNPESNEQSIKSMAAYEKLLERDIIQLQHAYNTIASREVFIRQAHQNRGRIKRKKRDNSENDDDDDDDDDNDADGEKENLEEQEEEQVEDDGESDDGEENSGNSEAEENELENMFGGQIQTNPSREIAAIKRLIKIYTQERNAILEDLSRSSESTYPGTLFIRANLLGRTEVQPSDNLYYICLESFNLLGQSEKIEIRVNKN